MRPLRLVLQAFGPYAGREEVNFDQALRAGLFGVYGPTGSGKSSIFNGIAFALFGETAKGDQDAATLRSDHAPVDLMTQVEYVFELGAQRYYLRRTPSQFRPAKRGEGLVEHKTEAFLYDATGIPLADICEQRPGKVLAEKKITAVKEEVERLLGYGPHQFRQIVLLPQGKFETFLSANSEDRLNILERLFDVRIYKAFAQTLREDAKTILKQVGDLRRLAANKLQDKGYATDAELAAALEASTDVIRVVANEVAERKSQADAAERCRAEAERLVQKFADRDAAVIAVKKLDARRPEIVEVKRRLDAAKLAQGLLDLDASVQEAEALLQKRTAALQDVIAQLQSADQQCRGAEDDLKAERSRQTELTALLAERAGLLHHAETLSKAEEKRKALADAIHDHSVAVDRKSQAERALAGITSVVAELSERLETARTRQAVQSRLSLALQARKTDMQRHMDRQRAQKHLEAARTETVEAEARLAQVSQDLQRAEDAYALADASLKHAHAVLLANALQPGQPCPVCGGTDHPQLAQHKDGSGQGDYHVQACHDALEQARSKFNRANLTLETAKARMVERQEVLLQLPVPVGVYEECQADVTALEQQLTDLGEVADPAELAAQLAAKRSEENTAQAALQVALTVAHTAEMARASASAALQTAIATVPHDLQTPAALDQRLDTLAKDIKAREIALQQAEHAAQLARQEAVRMTALRQSMDGAKTEAEAALKAKRDNFAQRLQDHGLSSEAYAAGRQDVACIAALQANVDGFSQSLATARDRLQMAETAVAGHDMPNMQQIIQHKEATQTDYEAALARLSEAKSTLQDLQTLQTSIQNLYADIAGAEDGYKVLGRVAEECAGDNRGKIKLETYAIAMMFDRVLAAANLRLRPMTAGRYTLHRSEDVGTGRGKRGLDIDVADVHTGRSRSPSTLSGGEMFTAALALALGLSDVVESVSGGIRLDTIFIDEGFGSLDQEALDQVLQKLQDLVGQNRAVGLISHVDLVQQTIPTGFQITKTAAGSHVAPRLG